MTEDSEGYTVGPKPPKPRTRWDMIRALAPGETVDIVQGATVNTAATGCTIIGKLTGRTFGRKVISEDWPNQTVRVKRFT